MANILLKKRVQLGLVLLVSTFIFGRCSEDPSSIGGALMPQKDLIQGASFTIDGITAKNVMRKAILSDQVSDAILGELNDPVFGVSKSSFVSQVNFGARFDTTCFNLSGYTKDSLVLTLVRYKNYWLGDTLATHILKVYELNAPLRPNTSSLFYYSNTDMTGLYYPVEIGRTTVKTGLNATQWTNNKNVDTIRIKLSDALADRFFQMNKDTISNNSAFKEFFKGIYIESELLKTPSSKGSLMYLSAWGTSISGITLNYHHLDKGVSVADTHFFPFTLEGTDFNVFSHKPDPSIVFENTATQFLYAQGMGGSNVNIHLPKEAIAALGDSLGRKSDGYTYGFSNVSLELFVDTTKSQVSKYGLPSSLRLFRYNSKVPQTAQEDSIIELPFMYTLDVKNVGVVPEATYNVTSASYTFHINNEFFQRVVTNDDALPDGERKGKGAESEFEDLYICPSNPAQNFNRVVFYGNENPTKRGVVLKVKRVKYKTEF